MLNFKTLILHLELLRANRLPGMGCLDQRAGIFLRLLMHIQKRSLDYGVGHWERHWVCQGESWVRILVPSLASRGIWSTRQPL